MNERPAFPVSLGRARLFAEQLLRGNGESRRSRRDPPPERRAGRPRLARGRDSRDNGAARRPTCTWRNMLCAKWGQGQRQEDASAMGTTERPKRRVSPQARRNMRAAQLRRQQARREQQAQAEANNKDTNKNTEEPTRGKGLRSRRKRRLPARAFRASR